MDFWKALPDACECRKNFFRHWEHQNKLLAISLGPWQHAEANGDIIRRLKQFLRVKTSSLDDF